MAEIDLTSGKTRGTSRASTESSEKTRATRANSGGKDTPEITDNALMLKLKETFSDIADWRDKKEDEELAEAIRESTDDMSKGLVALTRTVRWLRAPLGFAVNFIKPVLAFGKVGRILGERIVTARTARSEQNQSESPYVNQ